jgi:hypothetical protein
LCCLARNLFWICFFVPLFPCRPVASVSGFLILYSCFMPLSHTSIAAVTQSYFLPASVLRVSTAPCWISHSDLLVAFHFLGSSFFDSPISTPKSAVSFPADYFADSSTFSLRFSLAGALFSCCHFLIPACAVSAPGERLVAHRSSSRSCVNDFLCLAFLLRISCCF